MHDRPVEPYPRKVVVPAILRRIGCPVVLAEGGAPARAAAASDTVDWVRASIRRLPDGLLDLTLPDPGVMFRSWSLGARTRGAVARLGAPGPARDVRVRELVGAARLGPAALVDLLAAREENGPATGSDGVFPRRLVELAGLIVDRLPLRPSELGAIVRETGVAGEALDVDAVVRLFRDWDAPVPFRRVRRCGADVLVAPTSFASADALITAAGRTIQQAGLCRVSAVVERVRSFSVSELDGRGAARVLSTLPGFRWLDEAAGWFSLAGTSSLVASAVRKMLSVADAVTLEELTAALAKLGKGLVPPRPVLERYLSELLGCELVDGWVRSNPSFAPDALEGAERLVVEALMRHERGLSRAELQSEILFRGVAATTLRELLRTSPLVVASGREVRLVGQRSTGRARLAA
jgi:hypothetical protein